MDISIHYVKDCLCFLFVRFLYRCVLAATALPSPHCRLPWVIDNTLAIQPQSLHSHLKHVCSHSTGNRSSCVFPEQSQLCKAICFVLQLLLQQTMTHHRCNLARRGGTSVQQHHKTNGCTVNLSHSWQYRQLCRGCADFTSS